MLKKSKAKNVENNSSQKNKCPVLSKRNLPLVSAHTSIREPSETIKIVEKDLWEMVEAL